MCRSRQEIERAYFKEWEETTVLATQEGKREMTAMTLLSFLPPWFSFYAIPGPLRYLLHLVARAAGHVLYLLRKRTILKGGFAELQLPWHRLVTHSCSRACRLRI